MSDQTERQRKRKQRSLLKKTETLIQEVRSYDTKEQGARTSAVFNLEFALMYIRKMLG